MQAVRGRRSLTAAGLAVGLLAGVLPGSGLLVGVAAAGSTLQVAPISAPDTAQPFALTVRGLSSGHQASTVHLEVDGPANAGSAQVSGGTSPSSNTTLSADGSSATSTVSLRDGNGTPLGPGTYAVYVCDSPSCTTQGRAVAPDQGSLYVYAPQATTLTSASPSVARPGAGVSTNVSAVAFSVAASRMTVGEEPTFLGPDGNPTTKLHLDATPNEAWTSTSYAATVDVEPDAPAGRYQVRMVDTAGRASNTLPIFSVTPVLSASSVSPASVGQGARSFPVTVTGTGFRPGVVQASVQRPTVGAADSSITAAPQVLDATHVQVKLTVDPAATTGDRRLVLSNSDDGQSTGVTVTVVAAPSLSTATLAVSGSAGGTAVSGQALGQGAGTTPDSGPFTVTLSNVGGLTGSTAAVDLGPGVTAGTGTVTASTVSGLSTVTVPNVVVAAGATPGRRPVSVTDAATGGTGTCPSANGSASPACSLAVDPAPVPTGVDPGSVGAATTTPLSVSGHDFPTSASSVLVTAGRGLRATVTPSSSSSLTTPGYDATKDPTGPVAVALTSTVDGGTAACASCFTKDAFTLADATPASGGQAAANDPSGSPVTLNASGAGIPSDAQLQLVHDPGLPDQAVVVGSTSRATSTALTATVDLRGVAPGFYLVRAVSASDPGTLATCSCPSLAKPAGSSYGHLIVTANPPTVSAVSPGNVAQGATSFPVTVTGTNFFPGATVGVSGTGVTVDRGSVRRTSATSISLTLTVDPQAATGARDVTVTAADGYSATKTGALVVDAAPTLTSVSPTALGQGARTTVTVKGTQLSGSSRFGFGPGTTAGAPTVDAAGTTATVPVVVAAGAPTGGHDVTVTNADGGVATLAKALTVDPGPGIAGVSPSVTGRGTAFDLAITGSGFSTDPKAKPAVEIGTLDDSGAFTPDRGISVTSTSVSSDGSRATSRVTVSSSAAQGAHAVRVTNPDAGSTTCAGCLAVTDPPSAPQSVAARPGDGQVLVTWAPPASDGGAAVSAYTVDCTSTTDGGEVHETTVPGDAGQALVSAPARSGPSRTVPFSNGTPYRCAVSATNSGGTGPAGTAPAVTPVASERLETVAPTQVYAATVGRAPAAAPKPVKGRPGKARRASKPKAVRPTVASFVVVLGQPPANAQGAVVNATLTGPSDSSLALRGVGTPRVSPQLLAPRGLGKSGSLVVHFANGDARLQADFLGYRSRITIHLLGWLVRADQAGSQETVGDRYVPLDRVLVSYRLTARQLPDSGVVHFYDLSGVVPDDTEAVAVQLWSTNARTDGSISAYAPQDGPTVSSLAFHKGRVTSSFALLRVGPGVRPGSGGASCGICALFRASGRTGLEVRLLGYWRKAGPAGDPSAFGGRVVGIAPTLVAATPPVGGTLRLSVPAAVPSTASAVLVQLSAAGARRTSILQAYAGDASPYADQVSTTAGDAASDLAVVRLSADRRLLVRVVGAATRVRAEVVGYVD